MHVIVGLGNPGRRYARTRHNIGFILLDYIANELEIPFSAGKGDYYFGHFKSAEQEILFVKPTTYMNNVGLALKQLFNGAVGPQALKNVLIVYDDFQLPFGTLRFRAKGSDGGHNGIKSIIYHCQTDVFDRLKVGIGDEFKDVVQFVLSEFTVEQQDKIPALLKEAYKGIRTWLEAGIEPAMNNHNRHVLKQ